MMNDMKTYLITGGAGFIGSNFILAERKQGWGRVINLDLLTYAGNIKNLDLLQGDSNYVFVGEGCQVYTLHKHRRKDKDWRGAALRL
jgi:dTDP-D-glucose 4,6-dehydratase